MLFAVWMARLVYDGRTLGDNDTRYGINRIPALYITRSRSEKISI